MKSTQSFRAALVFLAAVALASLGGCGTMAGLGHDIQTAGEGIEDSAQDAMR